MEKLDWVQWAIYVSWREIDIKLRFIPLKIDSQTYLQRPASGPQKVAVIDDRWSLSLKDQIGTSKSGCYRHVVAGSGFTVLIEM